MWYKLLTIRTRRPDEHQPFPARDEVERILVGPESVTWRSTSDARLYAVMLYPLLLQVAHPTVGAGVRDYSDFERRPWNRLMRTIDYVTCSCTGPRRRRRSPAARHPQGVQGRARGRGALYALEPAAYAWVHATLIDTYVRGHAHFGRPMTPAQVD